MDDALKNLASLASRDIAGGAFKQTTQNMMLPKIVSISDHLRAMFSSSASIGDMAGEIETWKKETPEGKHLVLMLRTPAGEIMDVELIRPSGWQFFVAEGNVNGLPCKITGHIATLYLFSSYEETRKGKTPAGFTIATEPLNEPQLLPGAEIAG